jgi:hypothetical protein
VQVRGVGMSRRSGFLSEELSKSAQSELKKLGSNALIARKLEAIIAACKYLQYYPQDAAFLD